MLKHISFPKVIKMFTFPDYALFFGWPLPREVNSIRRPTKSFQHISQENKFSSIVCSEKSFSTLCTYNISYLFWQIKYFVAFVRDILLCDFVWTTRTRRIVWNFVNRRKVFGLTHKISFCSVTFCQLGKFRGKPCFCAGSCNISSSVFRN